MGREVRRVPKDWQHPKRWDGNYIPLLRGSYNELIDNWINDRKLWLEGYVWESTIQGYREKTDNEMSLVYEEENEDAPQYSEYMPDWPEEEKTHYQMYETCSEGTPISPVMKTPEELARWLVDNNASACADLAASYEGWLGLIRSGERSLGMMFCVTDKGTTEVSGVDLYSER